LAFSFTWPCPIVAEFIAKKLIKTITLLNNLLEFIALAFKN
jgi:hypothetical protein